MENWSLVKGLNVVAMNSNNPDKILIPEQCETEWIKLIHKTHGHAGIIKCINLVERESHFKRIKQKVSKIIRSSFASRSREEFVVFDSVVYRH